MQTTLLDRTVALGVVLATCGALGALWAPRLLDARHETAAVAATGTAVAPQDPASAMTKPAGQPHQPARPPDEAAGGVRRDGGRGGPGAGQCPTAPPEAVPVPPARRVPLRVPRAVPAPPVPMPRLVPAPMPAPSVVPGPGRRVWRTRLAHPGGGGVWQ